MLEHRRRQTLRRTLIPVSLMGGRLGEQPRIACAEFDVITSSLGKKRSLWAEMGRVDPTIDPASKANIAHEVDQLVRQADTSRREGDLSRLYLSVAQIPDKKRVY